MMRKDRVLRGATLLLRIALIVNIAALAAFAVGFIASWPFGHLLSTHLAHKYGASLDIAEGVTVMRLLMVLGIASSLAVHPIFASLIRIVATVQAGDPFVESNATLLMRIGWALLALQCLDLMLGALMRWIAVLKLDSAGWTPSLGGWIAVVMIFVLARVFRIGAQMRDDLATTV